MLLCFEIILEVSLGKYNKTFTKKLEAFNIVIYKYKVQYQKVIVPRRTYETRKYNIIIVNSPIEQTDTIGLHENRFVQLTDDRLQFLIDYN